MKLRFQMFRNIIVINSIFRKVVWGLESNSAVAEAYFDNQKILLLISVFQIMNIANDVYEAQFFIHQMKLVALFLLFYIAKDCGVGYAWVDFAIEEIYWLQSLPTRIGACRKVFMIL